MSCLFKRDFVVFLELNGSSPSVCFVRFLLQRDASLSAVNCDGDVPLDIALDESTESILQDYTQRRGEWCSVCMGISCMCLNRRLKKVLPSHVRRTMNAASAEVEVMQIK